MPAIGRPVLRDLGHKLEVNLTLSNAIFRAQLDEHLAQAGFFKWGAEKLLGRVVVVGFVNVAGCSHLQYLGGRALHEALVNGA